MGPILPRTDGVVVADGPAGALLADEALMRAHRLEPPFGFDPSTVPAPYAAPQRELAGLRRGGGAGGR